MYTISPVSTMPTTVHPSSRRRSAGSGHTYHVTSTKPSSDSLGRLTAVDDGQWPLAYEYDLQDRLITEQQGWATLRYRYDTLGQLSHCKLPDGNRLHYLYHPGGALKAINLNGQRLTGHRFEHGREIMRQQGAVLSEYHYDEQHRLKEHRVHPLDHNGEVTGHYHYRRSNNLR